MNLENVKFNTDTKLVLNIGDPMGKTNAPRAYNKLFLSLIHISEPTRPY